MKKTVIYIILSGWMFTSCGTYSRYHRPDLLMEDLYRNLPADVDTTTLASLSWREMFTDPKLQSLIETGLERNTDLNVARLRVEAAEAKERKFAEEEALLKAMQRGELPQGDE